MRLFVITEREVLQIYKGFQYWSWTVSFVARTGKDLTC